MENNVIEIKKFNDTPFISSDKNQISNFDTIEINNFAESIAEFIGSCETPMTIGLQGDWGTGKTSLMNMIKCYLPDKKFHKIDVNTWHYSMFRQDEYLGIVIVKSLVEELAKRFEKKDSAVAGGLKKLGNIIGSGLQKAINIAKTIEIGIPGGGVSIKDVKEAIGEKNNSLEVENLSTILLEFKQEFTRIIQENIVVKNERVFFFVDDLDRIRPIKAVEVLETLKNFMDVDGCVFVLAVDYEIVQLGIAEKFGKNIQITSGKSFFDKIIQLPFTMPTSSYNMVNYIEDLLTQSNFYGYKFDSNPQDKAFFVDITEVTVGRNPRSIKRAINYASLLEKIRAKNSTKENKKNKDTSKLLYAVVCMQIAWPELFGYFVLKPTSETIKNLENWDFLDKLPQAKKLFLRVNNVEEVKDNIAAFFDTLYSILDVKEKDGVITDEELQPLLNILELVKLTSRETINKNENPLKTFKTKLLSNSDKNNQFIDFYENIYLKSYWATNDEIEYKKAGERYFTIVWNRKQIGSLVTLKTKPFLFRLKEPKEIIFQQLSNSPDIELYTKIIKDLDKANTLTGIGDTEIDCKELIYIDDNHKALNCLNTIFNNVINLYTK